MKNRHGIPAAIEAEIRARDVRGVYCSKEMAPTPPDVRGPRRADWATIEHLCSGPGKFQPGQTAEDFAICCNSCNVSRGEKLLSNWIGDRTIAPVVQRFMARGREDQFSNRFSPDAAAYRAAWLVNMARPRGKRLSFETLLEAQRQYQGH